jgi:alkanesulfonate monooxygenase
MGVVLHWFLPTNGDSRTDLSLGNAVGAAGSRVREGGAERVPALGYIGQIARSAEQLGFTGALTPTSSWCEDAWIMTAGLTQVTERFKFLVAFRPGLMSPTLAAHMAATYQRISGARLLLNVVTGGDDVEQQRFGDHLGKAERYRRAGEFLHVVRELWTGEPVDFRGRHYDIRGGQIVPAADWPDIYLGGSSEPALDVAARYADVYLTWGEPPAAVAGKLDLVRERAKAAGRELRYGIRLHVITRDTAAEAWPRPSGCSTASTRPRSSGPRPSSGPRSPRGSGGWPPCTAAGPMGWRCRPTCGPVSAWSAAGPARRWSAAIRRWLTGSPSITHSASTSSSCPATRTWKRRIRSAKA